MSFLQRKYNIEQELFENKEKAIQFILANYKKVKNWTNLYDWSFQYYWTGEGTNENANPSSVLFFNFPVWFKFNSKNFLVSRENFFYEVWFYEVWIEDRKEKHNPLESIDDMVYDGGDFSIKVNGLWYNWIEGGEEQLADYIHSEVKNEL